MHILIKRETIFFTVIMAAYGHVSYPELSKHFTFIRYDSSKQTCNRAGAEKRCYSHFKNAGVIFLFYGPQT